MGQWGYWSFDNDTTLDAVLDQEFEGVFAYEKAFGWLLYAGKNAKDKHKFDEEITGVVLFAKHQGFVVPKTDIEYALAYLRQEKAELSNGYNIRGWVNSKKRIEHIDQEIAFLTDKPNHVRFPELLKEARKSCHVSRKSMK